MTTDDLKEIEAALGVLLNAYDAMDTVRADEARTKLLALIRQKLPQADAEHERAVEAWLASATSWSIDGDTGAEGSLEPQKENVGTGDELLAVIRDEIDQALRLMRARPAIELTNDEREAMKEPGVYAIDGRIVGVVDATATPVGRMVRMSARPVADKAAGELLRAAKALGYITGQPGYCGDHAVVSMMVHADTAKQWNAALQAAERAGIA